MITIKKTITTDAMGKNVGLPKIAAILAAIIGGASWLLQNSTGLHQMFPGSHALTYVLTGASLVVALFSRSVTHEE